MFKITPLAAELNGKLEKTAPIVFQLLSPLGKRLYFPKGIISQSAEAKEKAKKHNATIGIATVKGAAMHLQSVYKAFNGLTPDELFPYAPTAGIPALRKAWQAKQVAENPSMKGKIVSTPIVTSALTHGLSLVGDLFIQEGDVIVCPDMLWGNYRLTYEVRLGAVIKTHRTFTEQGGFDTEALRQALAGAPEKVTVILNFPNNPSGYTPNPAEAGEIVSVLLQTAQQGKKVVVILDDAYFALFYEDSIKESLFGALANLHPNLLAIKLDAATKEEFVWGFRTGFLTLGYGDIAAAASVYEILEKKIMGAIRGSISNSPMLSQTIVLKALQDPQFPAERRAAAQILQERALKVKEIVRRPEYQDAWTAYPFNSGYFMCLKLKGADSEKVRLRLLDAYQIGTISTNSTDLRVAFSSVDRENLDEVFSGIYHAVKDLQ